MNRPMQATSPANLPATLPSPLPAMAYLISRYPAVSHTFILREVRQLRALGFGIATASVNEPDQAVLPAEEAEEAARTYYLKRDGIKGALGAHLRTLAGDPGAWLRGVGLAFRLGGADPRRLLLSLAYFTEALMLGQWMRRQRLTHLHVHFATAAASIGLYVKRAFKTGFSLSIHGPDEFDNVETQWLAEKIGAADFLFCIGQYAKSQVMRQCPPAQWSKCDIAPLGVDLLRYALRAQPAEPAPSAPFHLLCVGRLTPAKGQHVLLDALIDLRRQGRNVSLTLVGTGPDEASLKQAVRAARLDASVSFTGALDQQQVHALYQSADAFVLPSFAEGIPVVLMEAMACGVPCITTRITGIPELIRSADEGLLVTPADAEALAGAIVQLMSAPHLRHKIRLAARARVLQSYDLERNVARLAALFCQRLKESA